MAPVNPSRKETQPYAAAAQQDWATHRLDAQHEEALLAFGELALFTLMWRPIDFEEGRVDRCPTCFGGDKARYAAAFEQPVKKECPDCFGTTFEGGFRAQIIRPAIFANRNQEMHDGARGTSVTDSIRVEITGDFHLRKDDYIIRFDNSRFQVEERLEDVPRDGFGPALAGDSVAGSTTAHREEETSVAFLIPPRSALNLRTMLGRPGPFIIEDLAASDILAGGGYL